MSALSLRWRVRWALRRWWEHYTPRATLRNWTYDGWGEHGYTPTLRTRFADWVLWKLCVCEVILRLLVHGTSDVDSCGAWWEHALLRAKAIVCLVLGRHWEEEEGDRLPWFRNGAEILVWNYRKTSYEYDEWDNDRLSVGMGWRDWRVQLEVHEP